MTKWNINSAKKSTVQPSAQYVKSSFIDPNGEEYVSFWNGKVYGKKV